jgi:hypothetical protein
MFFLKAIGWTLYGLAFYTLVAVACVTFAAFLFQRTSPPGPEAEELKARICADGEPPLLPSRGQSKPVMCDRWRAEKAAQKK